MAARPPAQTEQPAWLEDQEHDDQRAVDHRLQLEGARKPVRRRSGRHERQDRRELLHESRHECDERRSQQHAGQRARAADEDHREELDRVQQTVRARLDEAGDGRQQRTRDARVEARHRERQDLVSREVDADELGRRAAVAHRGEGPSDGGAREVPRDDRHRHEQSQAEQVELHLAVEAHDAQQRRRPLEVDAREDELRRRTADAGAAGDRRDLAEQMLADQHEAERHDREVQAAQAGRERCDRDADGGGDEPGGGQPDEHVQAESDDAASRVAAERGGGVGADAEKEGVAERHLTAPAGQDVEPDRRDRHREQGRHERVELAVEPEWQHEQRAEQHRRPAAPHTRCTCGVPNRPYGRTSSTASMTMYGRT